MKVAAAEERSGRGGRRQRVLDEAAKALNQRGVSQTSLSEIAQSVGVSRAALYYYFEDQEDLVFQCYRGSCERMARRLNEASHRFSGAFEIVDGFIDGMLAQDEPEFAALSEAAFLRPEQRSTIFGLYEGLRAKLVDVIEKGVKRGELRPCQAGLVAPSILGLICWVPTLRHWRTTDASISDLIAAIKEILHGGIAADRTIAADYVPFALTPLDLPVGRVFDQAAMAAARQEALLAAASWLFNLKGVDATSLEEIALRVGVTKKVIYHNMGDKQALVAQCHRRAFKFYESVVGRMRDHEGSRIDALCACVHAFAEASLREDIAPLPMITGYEALPEAERNEMEASVKRLVGVHLDTYARGRSEGSVRAVNGNAVTSVLPGLFEWLPKWFDAIDASERAEAPCEIAQLFRLGLRPI